MGNKKKKSEQKNQWERHVLYLGSAVAFVLVRYVFEAPFIPAILSVIIVHHGLALWLFGSETLRARREQRRQERREKRRNQAGHDAKLPFGGDSDLLALLKQHGLDPKEFEDALNAGSVKLVTLRGAVKRIPDSTVRGKVNGICDATARILTELRREPSGIRKAYSFLDYYLDATLTVVERYVSLRERNIQTADVQAALQRAEESMDAIRSAYDKQLMQLVENDMISLDVELNLLNRTIQMEGLGREKEGIRNE